MPIIATNPIEVPAVTLDKWWLKALHINAPVPGGEASLMAILIPYNDGGVFDVSKSVQVTQANVMAFCAQHPSAAQALGAVLAAIQQIGVAQGKL